MIGVSKPGAIGKPVPGHTWRSSARTASRADAGELGMIAVQRPNPVMFLEYWGRPEATAQKFIGDWMTTGDQGVVDEEGYITFVGRDDDVITSSGYRIGPGEIEDCLIKHPAVALAAVIGKPDPVRTEIVKAFIVLKPGIEGTDALAAEVRDFVKTQAVGARVSARGLVHPRIADDDDRQGHPAAAARSGLASPKVAHAFRRSRSARGAAFRDAARRETVPSRRRSAR